ncbi:MAG: peptidase M15 [Mycoplasma sp.]|nr:peptidase M15 [Mycoplasma sp.]
MELTKNFFLSEFLKSQTASRLGIDNTPTPEHVECLIALCENVLQPLRNMYGKSIIITSGYRSEELNKALRGSSKTSQHCKGQAADIDTTNDNADLFFMIKRHLPYDQLVWEYGDHKNPQWIHVSFKEKGNRRQTLRVTRQNGKSVYEEMA